MQKKKEKKEKNLLEMGVCRRERVACRWRYVQLELHADGLYGDVDGGSCRDGGHR